MKRKVVLSYLVVALVSGYSVRTAPAQRQVTRASAGVAVYFPERSEWQHKKPEEVGMDAGLLQQAVQAAIAADTPGPHDMTQFLKQSFGKEPFNDLIGPVK